MMQHWPKGREKYITDKVCIRVTEVTPDRLTFEISGIGEEHIHTGGRQPVSQDRYVKCANRYMEKSMRQS